MPRRNKCIAEDLSAGRFTEGCESEEASRQLFDEEIAMVEDTEAAAVSVSTPLLLEGPNCGGNVQALASNSRLLTSYCSTDSTALQQQSAPFKTENNFLCSAVRFQEAGWEFVTPDGAHQLLDDWVQVMMAEVSQDPVGLKLRRVNVTGRLHALTDLRNSTEPLVFFWAHEGLYVLIALLLCLMYMVLPCSVPMPLAQFVFENRLIYNTVAAFSMIFLVLLFVKEDLSTMRQRCFVVAVVILYNAQDITKLYVLSSQSWFTSYVEIFNIVNWAAMFVFFYWLRRHHPSVRIRGPVTIAFFALVGSIYCCLCLLEQFLVRYNAIASLGRLVQTLAFVLFFVWTTLCMRIIQMASRRIVCCIAHDEGRQVDWEELLRAQIFVFLIHMFQYAYYRLLFINVEDWYMEIVLIIVHLTQETLLYPVRLMERTRGLERRIIASLPSWLTFVVHPVLPLSIWMDLHCADYFLRKLAEVVSLILFVAQLLLFRYGYMSACYTPATFAKERLNTLLILSAVVLVVELVSGLMVVHRVVYRTLHRGFLFHQVVAPVLHRSAIVLLIVTTNCSVVFADALRHVKFT